MINSYLFPPVHPQMFLRDDRKVFGVAAADHVGRVESDQPEFPICISVLRVVLGAVRAAAAPAAGAVLGK